MAITYVISKKWLERQKRGSLINLCFTVIMASQMGTISTPVLLPLVLKLAR